MKITQIRNATIIINYNNTKFLVDPWLAPKDSMPGFEAAINSEIRQPRTNLPYTINEIVDVDAVIITHIHPDHWDEYAENALEKNIKIFVQSDNDKKFITSKGFTNVEILNDEGTEYHGIKLFKTTGQHGVRNIIKPICEQIGLPYDAMGVIFKSQNEKTLYVAGDTIWCEEVKKVLNKFNPDIIIVNACGATVLNGERLIMDKNDINLIVKYSPNAVIIASHMDTVSHLSVTKKDLKDYCKTHNINNILIPDDGESIDFPKEV